MSLLLLSSSVKASTDDLKTANKSYQTADKSHLFGVKQKYFNDALTIYLKVLSSTRSPSAELYLRLGNCYQQLNQLPLAILYYEKAIDIDGCKLAQLNLNYVKKKLNILDESADLSIASFLAYLPSEGHLISYQIMVASLAFMLYFFRLKSKYVQKIYQLSICFSFLLLLMIMIQSMIKEKQAILIEPSFLYPNAEQSLISRLSSEPEQPGKKFSVLSETDDQFSQVKTAKGLVGYLPKKSLKKI